MRAIRLRLRDARLIAVLAAAFALPTVAAAQQLNEEEDVKGREEWFWKRRSYPSGVRPYGQMLAASNEAIRRRNRAVFATALAGAWRPIGPFGFAGNDGFFNSSPQLDAGRIVGVQPPRVAGGPFFIAAASGGIWKTSALGSGWTPLTDDKCTLNIGSIVSDPVNPSIIYAGTGEYNVFSFGCGILRSTDAGATWTVFSPSSMGLTNGSYSMSAALYVDPATAGSTTTTVVIAAQAHGIYRSTNSGSTWTRSTQVTTAPSSLVSTKTGTIFTGVRDFQNSGQAGIWKSSNTGSTWTKLANPTDITVSKMGRIELAVSANAPDKVYALIADNSNRGLLGLWIYDDVAGTWSHPAATGVTQLATGRGDFGLQSEYDITIAVDPRDKNRIYLAGVRAYRSTDGGLTFNPMAMEIHCDWHSIVIDPLNPDIIYAGTDGGLFVSKDAGNTWTDRNAGLAITQYYPGISVHPSGTFVMGGSQDNGTHVFRGSAFWDSFNGGDGGYTAINYNDPTIMFGESQWSSGPHIVRRQGSSFSSRNSGIGTSDRGDFIPPLVMDPVTPTTMYFGTHKLYKTTDEGANWTALNGNVDVTGGTGSITAIAVSKSDPQVIYVGSDDNMLKVSTNGGTSFTTARTGLPNQVVTKIVINPTTSSHAILSVQGYGSSQGHVFETTTTGASWTNISGNLINVGANSVAMLPGSGAFVVGTDVGLFQTVDGGATWTAGPTGMPNVVVNDLVFQTSTNILYAATYGRGMFTFVVAGGGTVLRGDTDGNGSIQAADALLVQQALISTVSGTAAIYPRGDANCNGKIDAADVVLILRQAAGLTTPGTCAGTTA